MRMILILAVSLIPLIVRADWKRVAPPQPGIFTGYGSAQQAADAQRASAQFQKAREEAAARAAAAETARLRASQEAYRAAAAPILAARDKALAGLTAEHQIELRKLKSELTAATTKIDAALQTAQMKLERVKLENAQKEFTPQDPYRVLDRQLIYAKGKGWLVFKGKVVEVLPNGIRLLGSCSPPLEPFAPAKELFIAGFPYPVADHEEILPEAKMVAYFDETDPTISITNFSTVNNGVRPTLRKLNYGKLANDRPGAAKVKPAESPLEDTNPLSQRVTALTEEKASRSASLQKQIDECIAAYDERIQTANDECDRKINELPAVFAKAAKDQAAEKKRLQDAKVLEWHQSLADKGDGFGMCQMGRRYLTGDGVTADTNKARVLLIRAVELNITGAKELLERASP